MEHMKYEQTVKKRPVTLFDGSAAKTHLQAKQESSPDRKCLDLQDE